MSWRFISVQEKVLFLPAGPKKAGRLKRMDKRFKDLDSRIVFIEKTRKAAKEYFSSSQHQKQLIWFESWLNAQISLIAENLDECPECKSDPYKTTGACPCDHCEAIGRRPWGG